jgi:hypothetical protein
MAVLRNSKEKLDLSATTLQTPKEKPGGDPIINVKEVRDPSATTKNVDNRRKQSEGKNQVGFLQD